MDKSVKQVFDAPGFAAAYENKTEKANWLGPDVMFGMSYRYVHAGEKILDMGIGTGLCSELFHRAGLLVYGMDISAEMLKVAASKGFTDELREHNLAETPYPYADNSMDHVVCGGVMHIFADPSPIIREAARIIRIGGVFVFCCLDGGDGENIKTRHCDHEIHGHTQEFIGQRLSACQLKLCRTLSFIVDMPDCKQNFRAYVAKKVER